MNKDTKIIIGIICFFIVVFILIFYFKPKAKYENNKVKSNNNSIEFSELENTPEENTEELETAVQPEEEVSESKEEDTDIKENTPLIPLTPVDEEGQQISSSQDVNKDTETETLPDVENPDIPKEYIIKRGDTLISIAKNIYGDARFWKKIKEANPGLDENNLMPGTKINIPPKSEVSNVQEKKIAPDTDISTTSEQGKKYIIQPGDTLELIAEEMYGDSVYWPLILKANDGINPRRLKVGSVLIIPPISTYKKVKSIQDFDVSKGFNYTILPGDTLGKLAKRFYGKESLWKKIAEANPNINPNMLRVGQKVYIPPLKK